MEIAPPPAPALRPMTVTELIDASFRLYRANFVTFLGIVALLQIPVTIILATVQYLFGSEATTLMTQLQTGRLSPPPGGTVFDALPLGRIAIYYGLVFGVGILQVLVLQKLIAGALANAISRSYLGQTISIVEAYRFGAGRLVSLIGAAVLLFFGSLLLIGLPMACIGGAFVLLSTTGRSQGASTALIIGLVLVVATVFVLLIVGLVVLGVRLLFVTQTIVLEGRGSVDGLRRSWALSRGAFWRIIGASALTTLLVFILAAIPAAAVSAALSFSSGGSLDVLGRNQAINTLVSQVSSMVPLPFQLAFLTLLYYDLRVRNEGYDLELRSAQPVSL